MTNAVLLEPPVVDWYCPNCGKTDQTREANPHTRYHACTKLAGMLAPMLDTRVRAKVTAVEREDYVGGEEVTVNADGRPIMSVVTTRDEGQDCLAFAPCAQVKG